MKTLILTSAKEKVNNGATETEVTITTADLLKAIINHQPAGGYTIEEMMYRLKMRQLIEPYLQQVNDNSIKPVELSLEDADYTKLKELALAMKWAFPAQFIIDFVSGL